MNKSSKHYHLIGIGGIGMGSLAALLLSQGNKVSGSDLRENDMVVSLREKGAEIVIGHKGSNIINPDYVVYSSAVSMDNSEIKLAQEKNILILKRAEVLARLINEKKSITVAGAHGKTTTSAMMAHLFRGAGRDPTIAVGGILNNGKYSAVLGKGDYSIAEVDESDGSFLYFASYYAIITNIDFEHVDYYKDFEHIVDTYRKFVQKIDLNGCLFFNGDDSRLKDLALECQGKTISYGIGTQNLIFAKDVEYSGFRSRFQCVSHDQSLGEVELNVPGRHNVINALGVIAVAQQAGISFNVIQKHLKGFQGVQRRFSVCADIHDILIIDDYAHHPVEIHATLESARLLNKKRVIIVFQPHRYSRTKFFKDDFIRVLKECDYLIITDIYAASENYQEDIHSESICREIKDSGKKNVFYLKKEMIVDHLLENVESGDLVLLLGAGSINQLAKEFCFGLKKRFEGVLK